MTASPVAPIFHHHAQDQANQVLGAQLAAMLAAALAATLLQSVLKVGNRVAPR